MRKTSRRKQVRPAAKRKATFRLVIDAQEMVVSYQPRWMKDTAFFEFRSPHKPPRRIPISETGYLSYFAPIEDVRAAASPQAYAREAALALLPWRSKQDRRNQDQMLLFD